MTSCQTEKPEHTARPRSRFPKGTLFSEIPEEFKVGPTTCTTCKKSIHREGEQLASDGRKGQWVHS